MLMFAGFGFELTFGRLDSFHALENMLFRDREPLLPIRWRRRGAIFNERAAIGFRRQTQRRRVFFGRWQSPRIPKRARARQSLLPDLCFRFGIRRHHPRIAGFWENPCAFIRPNSDAVLFAAGCVRTRARAGGEKAFGNRSRLFRRNLFDERGWLEPETAHAFPGLRWRAIFLSRRSAHHLAPF